MNSFAYDYAEDSTAIDPQIFFAELEKRGIIIHERIVEGTVAETAS